MASYEMTDGRGNYVTVDLSEVNTYKARGYAVTRTSTRPVSSYDTWDYERRGQEQNRIRYDDWIDEMRIYAPDWITTDPAAGGQVWETGAYDALVQNAMSSLNVSEQLARSIVGELSALEQVKGALPATRRRGGGGRAGPTYVAPDRRTVQEAVEAQLVSLTGEVSDSATKSIVNAFMRDHRKAWEGASVDPSMTVLEEVRKLESYKKAHKLRPDGANESTWISNRRQAYIQQGGRESVADDRAIEMASVGAGLGTDQSLYEFSAGFQTPGFFQKLGRAAQQVTARLN